VDVSKFPAINASLNASSAVLLVLGWTLIKQRAITAHTVAMISATLTSVLFLGFYLTYHYYHGSTPFPGQGPVRVFYFTVLITHTVLSIVNLPLIFLTYYHAFRGDFFRHARVARVLFPSWLYVSITGVAIYWMLYRIDYP
jgi:uncharacterized membrane protein YozB (DUF420 family)